MGEVSPQKNSSQWVKGQSGNPAGRPRGSKNKLTILKQSLEVQLREQAAPELPKLMDKAVELALEGDRTMLKLLLELHMSKGIAEDKEVVDKVSITIGTHEQPEVKNVTIEEGNQDVQQAITSTSPELSDSEERLGDSLSGTDEG